MAQTHLQRYDFIDSLRGFAILGVILVHTAQWIKPSSAFLSSVASHGARGVQLFFMASALTLFLSLAARRKGESRPYLSFALRRFFRIAPLFYIAIFVYLAYLGMDYDYWAPNGIEWWSVPLTALFLHGWHPETISAVVPGGWSIAAEMTFYLIVPVLFLHLRDVKRTVFAFFAAVALNWILTPFVIALLSPQYPAEQQYLIEGFVFFWFFSQLPVFLLGILLFHLLTHLKDYQNKKIGLCLIVLGVVLWLSLIDLKTFGSQVPTHVFYGFAFLFFSLGLYLYPTRVLVNGLTRGLGQLSYSLYLTHFAVIYLLRDLALRDQPISGDWQLALGFLLVACISVFVSFFSYQLVEKPGIALGARLVKRVNEGKALKIPEPASAARLS